MKLGVRVSKAWPVGHGWNIVGDRLGYKSRGLKLLVGSFVSKFFRRCNLKRYRQLWLEVDFGIELSESKNNDLPFEQEA